jgi:hypothetical protein
VCQQGGITRSSVKTDRVFLYQKQKEESKMTNKLLVRALVKCFGETSTIKMLNQLQHRTVSKKAKRYKASIHVHPKATA